MAKQKVTSFCANWQEDMDGVEKNITGSSPFLEILKVRCDKIIYIFGKLLKDDKPDHWHFCSCIFLYFGTESRVIPAGE